MRHSRWIGPIVLNPAPVSLDQGQKKLPEQQNICYPKQTVTQQPDIIARPAQARAKNR
jgi:hypothetical protein